MTSEPMRGGGASAEPLPDPGTCRNCGEALTRRYCAACGQEDKPLAPSLREVLGDAWEALTNIEGRGLRSLGRLFLAPGFLTREHFDGRRVRWVSPFRLYLVVSVAYFGLTSLTGWGGFTISADVTGDTGVDTQAELERLGFASESELDAAAERAVATWLPRAMFLLVPVFALLVSIARRPAGRTYPEHLTFSLHFHAASFGAFMLPALAEGLLDGVVIASAVGGAALLYALAYLVLALRRVYGGSLRRNVVQGLAIGVTYWMLTIGVTIGIVAPVVISTR